MSILIVDDSESLRLLLQRVLESSGYENLCTADSAMDAFAILGMNNSESSVFVPDVILMDIVMPDMDGISACRRIKETKHLRDIPIVMVTAKTDNDNLQRAFEAGAADYVTKPINKVELLARVRSVLRLKKEMDRRMEVTRQLEEANRRLQLLSSLDGLTGIANRRHFDETLQKEWRRALRNTHPLSLILLDIDFFKPFNDNYGHQTGDDCLKQVARTLSNQTKRPGDFIARYGGEEFVVVLPETKQENAERLAEDLLEAVKAEKIPHAYSKADSIVTISLGVATMIPDRESDPGSLIKKADEALYQAKLTGRSRVKSAPS